MHVDFIQALVRAQLRPSEPSWPANVSFGQLLQSQGISARYALGIYAGEGTHRKKRQLRDVFDELNPIFASPDVRGLSIEPSRGEALLPTVLLEASASGRVKVAFADAHAAAVLSVLSAHGVPRDLDAMKVDTDSADLSVLRGILSAGYVPKVVCIRVNSDIPPPVRWHVQEVYGGGGDGGGGAGGGGSRNGSKTATPVAKTGEGVDDFVSSPANGLAGHGLAGASADEIFALASAHGYALLAFEFGRGASGAPGHVLRVCTRCPQNAWLVRKELLPSSLEAARPATLHATLHATLRATLRLGSWATMNTMFWSQLYAQHAGMQSHPAKYLFASRGKGAWMYDVLRAQAADTALRAWGENATGARVHANARALAMEQPPENNS